MSEIDLLPEELDFLFNQVIIIIMIVTLLIKALALRRQTRLGGAMSRFNVAVALAYLGVLLALFFSFFVAALWRIGIRFLVLFTALQVIWELHIFYGGWRGLWEEVWNSFLGMLPRAVRERWPTPDQCQQLWRRLCRREEIS
jgi:hypothetical protein